MITGASLRASLLILLSSAASAQMMSLGPNSNSPTFATAFTNPTQSMGLNESLFLIDGQIRSPLETPGGSLSKLDLKAPGKARKEYDKGYQLLQRKDLQGAVEHLTTATSIYSSYVAAHNALGSAYLGLKQNDQARAEFAQAIALDDHLPTSYLNLGCAELALQHFPAAEEAIKKASDMAPLDLQLLTALTYGQFMNHDYAGAIATARQVHKDKHDGAAMVHFYAAAAWAAQEKLPEAQKELLTLLREDPKSPAALAAVQIMEDMKRDQNRPRAAAAPDGGLKVSITEVAAAAPTGPVELPERIRKLLQDAKESSEIADAEAEGDAPTLPDADTPVGPVSRPNVPITRKGGLILHASTDEVAVFFAATDHGKSVTNLTAKTWKFTTTANFPQLLPDFATRLSCHSASVWWSTPALPLRIASSSSKPPPAAS